MSKDEIDIMWQKAMKESIKEGEMYTRYHFAKLVAAKERKECEEACEHQPHWTACCAAIRARGQA